MMKIDLHLHTFFSDGLLSPEEVVDNALIENLDVISITDHDNVDGIDRAMEYSKNKDIKVIAGIEFSCVKDEEEIHILGYNFDYKNQLLLQLLEDIQKARIDRAKKIINKLNEGNIDINYKEVEKYSNKGSVGRPHIGKVLMDKGYVHNIEEAFDKYIGYGQSCYIPRYKLTVEKAINIIHKLGGVAVLAHPILLNNYKYIDYCIEQGIDGIESIHSKHSKKDTKEFNKIAIQNNIMTTAGSDCHGQVLNGDLLIGKYYKYVNNLKFLNL